MNSKNISSKLPRILLSFFQILCLVLVLSFSKEDLNINVIKINAILIVAIYFSNLILYKYIKGDHYIFLIAAMLLSIGLIMIYRLNPFLGTKQLILVILGITSFYLTYFILKHIKIWDKLLPLYLGVSYLFFFLTLTLSIKTHGAKNWIVISENISFQPAELTKIILIFILASYYGREKEERFLHNSKYEKYSSLIIMGIVYSFILLLFLQKDLGMSLIFYGIFLVVQFIFEEDRRVVLLNILLFTISGIIGIILFNHVRIRFSIWINPWKYATTTGYQIVQSLFAIAEGGFFGRGLGLGNPQFIPLSYNDFIFSAIIEEMGVFMGIAIIMLFMILVYRGFKIGLSQKNKFLKVLAYGASALFGVQSFIILGGVLKVIPLTGITLPFIAYGGTSIISSFIGLGILQAASEEALWEGEKNE